MKAVVFAGGALALSLASSAWAGPTAQGLPFRINPCTTCRQEVPAVASNTTGNFLTAWEGASSTDNRGIVGRVFTAQGAPAAAAFQVNKDLTPDQYDAAVARDNQGNFIVVWSAVAAGNSEIFGQRYNATGTALGAAFKVNQDAAGTPTIPADFKPAIARMNDGGFIVTWINQLPAGTSFPGTNPQVLARRFSALGQPLNTQVKINTGLVAGERPDVCVDTTGRPVVVWPTVNAFRPFETTFMGVALRRLSPAGAPIETETVVAAPTAASTLAAVGCGKGNTFVVVWHSNVAPAVEDKDVLAQRFSRLGRKVGGAIRLNAAVDGDQRTPDVSFDPQGNFVAVWRNEHTNGINGRRFNGTTGAPMSPDFVVVSKEPGLKAPLNPAIAHLGNTSNFVVVWNEGSTSGIFGRRFIP
jgi:hypothetical protein